MFYRKVRENDSVFPWKFVKIPGGRFWILTSKTESKGCEVVENARKEVKALTLEWSQLRD